jgi:hypothetical protein
VLHPTCINESCECMQSHCFSANIFAGSIVFVPSLSNSEAERKVNAVHVSVRTHLTLRWNTVSRHVYVSVRRFMYHHIDVKITLSFNRRQFHNESIKNATLWLLHRTSFSKLHPPFSFSAQCREAAILDTLTEKTLFRGVLQAESHKQRIVRTSQDVDNLLHVTTNENKICFWIYMYIYIWSFVSE